jgi:hypothetical protein
MERSEGDTSLKNPVTPQANDPGTVRLVAQRLTHYATQAPYTVCTKVNYRIVPVTNINKYLRYGISGTEKYVYKYRCK